MKVKNILTTITSANGTNQVSVLKLASNREAKLLELQAVIKLPSITELPTYEQNAFLDDEQKNALFWSNSLTADNKTLNTHFKLGSTTQTLVSFPIFKRTPYYIENLKYRFTSQEELLMETGTEILISVTAGTTGNLSTNDSVLVFGTYLLSDAFYE